jgi:hypothetical protein
MTHRVNLILLLTYVPALLLLAVVAGVSFFYGVGIPQMTRDFVEIAGIHPLSGALSYIGILLWWTSASIWLFSAGLYWTRKSRELFRFALFSGLLSGYIAFDDLFCFHEILAPRYLGIPEKLVYVFLVIAVVFYLIIFRKHILQLDGLLLLLALSFLGFSVFVDAFLMIWLYKQIGHWSWFVEDGAKWLGIAGWCGFCIARCRKEVLTPETKT